MDFNTFWDRRPCAIVLGLFTFLLGTHELILAFHGMTSSGHQDPAAILRLLGSIAPFMVGLMVTICVSTSDRLLNMTWTSINNMWGGLLGGYFLYLFGISSFFTGNTTNSLAGGIIAGIGASLAVASLIKWP